MVTAVFGGVARTSATSASAESMRRSPILVITSPVFNPAVSAGPPGVTCPMVAPTVSWPLAPVVASDTAAPSTARVACPVSMISCAIRVAWSMGIAKPTPMDPPRLLAVEDSDAIAAFTAITLPVRSTSGPPEFPGLIAASVWIASITVSWL